MKYDPLGYKYPSRRSLVYGNQGMVATSQPLAAQAGLDILKKGGNAVDAAIATAATLTVVEPTGNGLGSDAFAIIWMKKDKELYGLNASGKAPYALSVEQLKEDGHEEMPVRGWEPVMVPGMPAGWAKAHERFGKLPYEELFEPAINYAENGYPVSPVVSRLWQNAYDEFAKLAEEDDAFQPWVEQFAPEGRAPLPGEMWKSPTMAWSLRQIAETKSEDYYKGEIAERLDAASRKHGGYLRKEDLEDYEPQWVDPITTNYRGYDVWEIPPNGNGIIALMGLNILKQFDFTERETFHTIHHQIEALKLAFADAEEYVADPKTMDVTVEELLSEEYAKSRAELITDTALMPEAGDPKGAGTVYLSTADEEGNMVSWIQSNYHGFGSGIVAEDTGISLQNRALAFSWDEKAANYLEPGKKSFHTIIPGFLSKNGEAVGPFGIMGAAMQPQMHIQALTSMIDFHLNPQEALDAPRWMWTGGKTIALEMHFDKDMAARLARAGHDIEVLPEFNTFGRGQMIFRTEHGTYVGATEPRVDGTVASW